MTPLPQMDERLCHAVQCALKRPPESLYDLKKVKVLNDFCYFGDPYYQEQHSPQQEPGDFSAIGQMENLHTLLFTSPRSQRIPTVLVEDFSFLPQCGKLKKLDLRWTNFADCTLLLRLPALKQVRLPPRGQLTGIEALDALSQRGVLVELPPEYVPPETRRPAQGSQPVRAVVEEIKRRTATDSWRLTLQPQGLPGLLDSKLGGLPLKSLFISKVDTIESLTGLEQLTSLDLDESANFSDLSFLMGCPNLRRLSVVDTAVRDLSPLAGHPNLEEIFLSATKVTDVSPLAAIPTLKTIWLYGTAVEDVSSLAALPNLCDLNLYKTRVADLSAFRGKESILGVERKKLGIVKAGKSAGEIKTAIKEVQERLDKLGVIPRPPLKKEDIAAFQEKTGVKLPKEYVAFLTKIGDGFEVRFQSFLYKFPPLEEAVYDPQGIQKRFSHREAWVWEDDDSATDKKIAAATANGQLQLMDRGCGQSYRLIVCGGAKGEVWDVTDVGIAPYGNGLDFLDWLKDFLDEKAT